MLGLSGPLAEGGGGPLNKRKEEELGNQHGMPISPRSDIGTLGILGVMLWFVEKTLW